MFSSIVISVCPSPVSALVAFAVSAAVANDTSNDVAVGGDDVAAVVVDAVADCDVVVSVVVLGVGLKSIVPSIARGLIVLVPTHTHTHKRSE